MSDDFILDPQIAEYMFQPDAQCDDELEADLLKTGGARDKLVVVELPDGTRRLVDGHRRKRLCDKHKLPYEVSVTKLGSRDDIFDFMDTIQLSRRNLAPNQLSLIRGRRKQRHEEKLGAVAAAEKVAADAGVSVRTVYRDEKYAKAVEQIAPKLRDQVVADLTQEQAIELAKVPAKQQGTVLKGAKAGKGGGVLRKPKPDKTLESAKAVAGKTAVKLQNELEDVHKQKADQLRLRSCKDRAKEIGKYLDAWGT